MACSTKALKINALIWDALYAIFGLIIVGAAIYIVIKFEHFNECAFGLLGLGLVVLLVAAFGALGAARESSRISKTYAGLLVVLVLVQILLITFCWIFKTTFLINFDHTFDQLWHEQPVPITPDNGTQIAGLERWLECCGNVGPRDYVLPPYSCYNDEDKLSLDGCRQKFLDYISDRWTAFSIISLGLVALELICAIFAYVFANSLLNRWRRSKYYPK